MPRLYNTGINEQLSGKELDELFGGRGDMFLTNVPARLASERGYGNMANKKKPLKPSYDVNACFPTPKTTYGIFNMVKTDFPKGAGGVEPNPMWADGTYDQMKADFMRQAERQIESENIRNLIPERDLRYDLAKYTGGTAQQNKLDFAIVETLTEEQRIKDAQFRQALEKQGLSEENIYKIMAMAKAHRETEALSAGLRNIPGKETQDLVRKLVYERRLAETIKRGEPEALVSGEDYNRILSFEGDAERSGFTYEDLSSMSSSVKSGSHPEVAYVRRRTIGGQRMPNEAFGVGGFPAPLPLFAGGGGSGGGIDRKSVV